MLKNVVEIRWKFAQHVENVVNMRNMLWTCGENLVKTDKNLVNIMEMTLLICGFHRKISIETAGKQKLKYTIAKWKMSGVNLDKAGGGNIGI